ncbi:hypothetical protein M0812_26665 [Anaeramoeba flamelloides]|uniref:Uncharacterized protein n=1 Tax=Anaeramoeba flamelloides TaxID=1746091 RepID=A0AAV7YDW1_9EUKA|nr:hypothetical protein M0812_26665 [Anaeramoeba flamelloides]
MESNCNTFQKYESEINEIITKTDLNREEAAMFLELVGGKTQETLVAYTLFNLLLQKQNNINNSCTINRKPNLKRVYRNEPLHHKHFNLYKTRKTTTCPHNEFFLDLEKRVITKEQLSSIVNQSPSLGWNDRFLAFQKYNPKLIINFPEGLYNEQGVKINKQFFQLYQELNPNIKIKNLQRGIIYFFQRFNLKNSAKFDRNMMVFRKINKCEKKYKIKRKGQQQLKKKSKLLIFKNKK